MGENVDKEDKMENYDISNLEKTIKDTCLIEGDFLLASGVRSTYYFDKYQFQADPELLNEIAHELTEIDVDYWRDIDYVAGLEMGGISIATMISSIMDIPMLQVRKKAKEYGTAKGIEGPNCIGKRVSIIEDVVTSGGAVLQATSDLRAAGATVVGAHCVILRDNNGKENLINVGVPLYALFDFTPK